LKVSLHLKWHYCEAFQGRSGQQVLVLKIFLVLVAGLAAAFALLTVPALCEPLGLCPAEETGKQQKENEQFW